MHTYLRIATFLSVSSTACLIAGPAIAQTPVPAPAPRPPAAVRTSPRTAPRPAQAPAVVRLDFNDPDWLLLDEARDDALTASRDAASRVRDMAVDLGGSLAKLDWDTAPMLASLDAAGRNLNVDFGPAMAFPRSESPRAPWAASDPADSLYRVAREALNSGDYRRAAQMFAQITRQYPTSQYSADAAYWRAFALYRIGDTADLHEALQVLDSAAKSANASATASATASPSAAAAKSVKAGEYAKRAATVAVAPRAFEGKFEVGDAEAAALSNAAQVRIAFMKSARRSDNESAILAMRIRSALAARGDAAAAAQIANTAGSAAASCDDEDASLRIEALNALVQMDPKNAEPAITKVLARRDSCSVPLRRGAIAIAARNNDAHTTDLLISTARTDPSIEVQAEAIRGLSRVSDASTVSALSGIVTSSANPAIQRIAVRSLASQDSPEAHQALRSLMARSDLPTDVRVTALHYAGKSDLQIADLTRIYDASADRSTREEIVSLLEQRKEPEAADELIKIARTSTDPALRRRAIDALAQKKDPRTTKLLMDILSK